MLNSIDDPIFSAPENYMPILDKEFILSFLNVFFTKEAITYEVVGYASYQDGSVFITVTYMDKGVKYQLSSSKFGSLFTLECFDGTATIWDSAITPNLLNLYTTNGFIYVDAGYARSNLYDGVHAEYKELSIYDRFFSECYPYYEDKENTVVAVYHV